MIKTQNNDKRKNEFFAPKNFRQNLTIYLSKYIYEKIISPEFSKELVTGQKELAPAHIQRIAHEIIKALKVNKIQHQWFTNLNKISSIEFKEGFNKFQQLLKKNHIFYTEIISYLNELIKLVFGLYSGENIPSTLHDFRKLIADVLKTTYGFASKTDMLHSFEYYFTIFLCRYLYLNIISPEYSHKLMKDGIYEPSNTELEEIIGRLLKEPFLRNWINELSKEHKQGFENEYIKFNTNFNTNQLYQKSYIDFLRYIIKFIFDCIRGRANFTELSGIRYAVVNDLRTCFLFEMDPLLPKKFKIDLMVLLCRYLFYALKYLESLSKIKTDEKELPEDIIKSLINDLGENSIYFLVNDYWLGELNDESRELFLKYYSVFQARLKDDQIYYENFLEFLQRNLKFVYGIITNQVVEPANSSVERRIIYDLKNRPIDTKIYNKMDKIYKEKIDFKREELSEQIDPIYPLTIYAENKSEIKAQESSNIEHTTVPIEPHQGKNSISNPIDVEKVLNEHSILKTKLNPKEWEKYLLQEFQKYFDEIKNSIFNYIFLRLSKNWKTKLTYSLVKRALKSNPYFLIIDRLGIVNLFEKEIKKYLIAIPLILEPHFSTENDKKFATAEEISHKSGLKIEQIQQISDYFKKNFDINIKSNKNTETNFNQNNENTNVYHDPIKWIKIDSGFLKDLIKEIRDKGYFFKDIDKEMGNTSFKGVIYERYKLREKDFELLKNILLKKFGRNILFELFKKYCKKRNNEEELLTEFERDIIPHTVYFGNKKFIPLEINELTSEFMAIMLGDGYLGIDGKEVSITLNSIDEPEYIKYVMHEIIDKIFGKDTFYLKLRKGERYCNIQSGFRNIHYSIKKLGKGIKKTGLIPGNKVDHQVSVPEWAFEKIDFIKKWLKGLFDTDGSITLRPYNFALVFVNASEPLVDDFIELCHLIGVSVSKSKTPSHKKEGKYYNSRNSWSATISAIVDVNKFIELIDSEKLKESIRQIYLAARVIFRDAPKEVKNAIQEKIDIWQNKNNLKKFSYTQENALFLKKIVEEEIMKYFSLKQYEITEDVIIEAIKVGRALHSFNGIILNKEDEIIGFPNSLRIKIIDEIIKIFMISSDLSDLQILEKIKENLFGKSVFKLYSKYLIVLEEYITVIIKLIRKYINLIGSDNEIIIKEIYSNLDLNLPYSVIREILQHLKEEYYGDSSSKYLLGAYEIYLKKELNRIKTTELSNKIGVTSGTIIRVVQKLIDKDLFNVIVDSKGNTSKIYELTETGIERAKRIRNFLSKFRN